MPSRRSSSARGSSWEARSPPRPSGTSHVIVRAPRAAESTLASLGQALVRPAAGIAYTRERNASYRQQRAQIVGHDLVVGRIKDELDPRGTLS